MTPEEAAKNFFFRSGDWEHSFENGRLYCPEWRDLSEEEVLIDRAAKKLKPVAEIVVQPDWDRGARAAVLRKAYKRGLTLAVQRNEWGVTVVFMTAEPDKTLQQLLLERGWEGKGLEFKGNTGRRKVGWYVKRGFDMSSKATPVDALTSGLLLGYPLDLARQHVGLA